MTRGGVGRGAARSERADVRGDRLAWLADQPHDAAETAAFALFEDLRSACNRALTLGLFEFEGHYALYPPGASYARHRDRFRDDDARVLSCVLYLNDGWQPGDGGALRLHLPRRRDTRRRAGRRHARRVPVGGVRPRGAAGDARTRIALTGWFRASRRRSRRRRTASRRARIFHVCSKACRALMPPRCAAPIGSPIPCPHAPRRLTIATRESALALWQAEHIRARLAALLSRARRSSLLGVTTQGDRIGRPGRRRRSAARACSSRSSRSRWRKAAPTSPCIR